MLDSEKRRRVAEALESVGLTNRAHHRPDLLSGGERQRVAVARAIVHRPALVLADEPTANLDTQTARQLMGLMRELNHQLELTFLFSTHDQRLLDRADRIVRLCDGRVVEDTREREVSERKFLLLAFRNVFRNRRHTMMALLVVAGGVAGLLLVGGFFSFMFWGLRESTIRNGLGHLQVFNAERFRRDEMHVLENGLDHYRKIAAMAEGLPHVRGVTARIEFYGMVSNGAKSSVFMGSAVESG